MPSSNRAAMLGAALLAAVPATVPAAAWADPISILFVGNSFTHGKYDPVRTYNSGFGTGSDHVHDDNCLSAATCASGETTPPAAGVFESGPFGGIPGIFLQLTKEAGLNYDVSINAVSSATLTGHSNSRGGVISVNPLTGKPFDTVVLQEQSFTPLPNPNGLGNTTRGNYAGFVSGANALVTKILAADAAARRPATQIYLYETQPLASYTYTSPLIRGTVLGDNPAPYTIGKTNQPYVGAPIETMAADLHDAYTRVAAQNPAITGVAYAGDAWIRAIQAGVAQRNPYLDTEPAGQVNLWDGPADYDAACCTTPIGYHPSKYGAYLNALMLFGRVTGLDPARFGASEQAAAALGIDPVIAVQLQQVSEAALPEPGSLGLLGAGVLAAGALGRRRRSPGGAA